MRKAIQVYCILSTIFIVSITACSYTFAGNKEDFCLSVLFRKKTTQEQMKIIAESIGGKLSKSNEHFDLTIHSSNDLKMKYKTKENKNDTLPTNNKNVNKNYVIILFDQPVSIDELKKKSDQLTQNELVVGVVPLILKK